jgi:hypothetical protein
MVTPLHWTLVRLDILEPSLRITDGIKLGAGYATVSDPVCLLRHERPPLVYEVVFLGPGGRT